jgi:iron complex outermembrane receptor protein
MSLSGFRMPMTFAVLGLAAAMPANAADQHLEEIVVTATRTERQLTDVPMSVSVVNQQEIQQGQQLLGLDESLNRVPGLFMQDRYNFAQDLRIAIRGAGSRANFGIRGIKIYIDGIPATTTDGQGGVDDIDLGSAKRVEVIRGPASSLYGSSSGGVISIFTEDGPKIPFVQVAATMGQYDMKKYQVKTGGEYNKLNYLLNFSQLNLDGYRDNSEVDHTMLNSKFRYTIDDGSDLTLIFNAVDSPTANDPGGLTAALVEADPRQAWGNNVLYKSGEALKQQRVGLVYNKDFGPNQHLTVHNFYLWRDFITFLPFASGGVSAFQRFYFGGGGQYEYSGDVMGYGNRLIVGFDADAQRDDRQRYDNNFGVKGPLTLDQLEHAESYGFYFRDEFDVIDSVQLSVGGRYDIVDLGIDDHFLSNGDQSGKLNYKRFNPTAGVLWKLTPDISLYGNYGTAFETPTFSEFGSAVQDLGGIGVNLGGFNNVKPQTAESFEIGTRGRLWERMDFDLAAYTMKVKNEIVNVATIGNRGVFENADTRRKGIEALAVMDIIDNLKLTATYTYSDFKFKKFSTDPTVVGNRLPVIPQNQFYSELAYRHPSGLFAIVDVLWVDRLYTNNDNTAINQDYYVANIRFGTKFDIENVTVSPFIGVNNFTDVKYNGNVRANAFGGRFYEPAPQRNVYGGLTVRYNIN